MWEYVSITKFRERSGPLFTEAVHRHRPIPIKRGEDEKGLLFGQEEVIALLSEVQFRPEVMRGDSGVSIWLPELEVFGDGASYAEAKTELADEVRAYVQEYLDDLPAYRAAPNRAGHFAHIIKAYVADEAGVLIDTIFAPPAQPGASSRKHPASA